jgi:ssRNA-specific RNase YbeY (16S rRNA maturation enzyme)
MNKFKYNINYKVKIDDAFKKKLEKKYKKIATIISEFLNISKPLFFDVTFTSLNQIHKINKEKRDVDKPTDVISFSL